MAGDFFDRIEPIDGKREIDRLEGGEKGKPRPPARRGITGHVVAVRRGLHHAGQQHRLDVSVGGEETTEIIVRVPRGAYAHLEGKRVVFFVDE